eukprot:1149389-Pelagomonas_calceolata.AAC.4
MHASAFGGTDTYMHAQTDVCSCTHSQLTCAHAHFHHTGPAADLQQPEQQQQQQQAAKEPGLAAVGVGDRVHWQRVVRASTSIRHQPYAPRGGIAKRRYVGPLRSRESGTP